MGERVEQYREIEDYTGTEKNGAVMRATFVGTVNNLEMLSNNKV